MRKALTTSERLAAENENISVDVDEDGDLWITQGKDRVIVPQPNIQQFITGLVDYLFGLNRQSA